MKKRRRFRLWAAREGLGAIEFAFIAPFLLALLLGVLDFGMAYWQQMQVANAADAGAQWGMANGYDTASITTAATNATRLAVVKVSPSNPCGCPSDTGITTGYGTPPSCQACPDLSTAHPYISVTASACYKTLFSWPGLTYCSGGDSRCTAANCTSSQILLSSQSVVLQ